MLVCIIGLQGSRPYQLLPSLTWYPRLWRAITAAAFLASFLVRPLPCSQDISPTTARKWNILEWSTPVWPISSNSIWSLKKNDKVLTISRVGRLSEFVHIWWDFQKFIDYHWEKLIKGCNNLISGDYRTEGRSFSWGFKFFLMVSAEFTQCLSQIMINRLVKNTCITLNAFWCMRNALSYM